MAIVHLDFGPGELKTKPIIILHLETKGIALPFIILS
jgi:hypothetical protein